METFEGKVRTESPGELCWKENYTLQNKQGKKQQRKGDGHLVKVAQSRFALTLASSNLSLEGALPCHSGSLQEATAPGLQLSH